MSLKEKHEQALSSKDYCSMKAQSIVEKFEKDDSGACWHKEEVKDFMFKQAEQLDSLPLDVKKTLPFFGLSVGMKDLFCIKGLTTTAGSKILDTFKAPYDSFVWSELKNKGVLLGAKLAMDEFAMGSFSNTSYLGKVSIPKLSEHTAGGSSGGSSASVKADIVDFSMGSDTGGSVRQPASFCSLVGYKPSYGVFSRKGMIAYASSLDQAGVITHSLKDLSYLLDEGLGEKDNQDMTSKGLDKVKTQEFRSFGFFESIFTHPGVSEDVKLAYQKSIERLKSQGLKAIRVDIPLMSRAAQIYYIIACSEASSNLARYQGVFFGKKLVEKTREGSYWEQAAQFRSEHLGLEVQKRIMLGSFILSAENFSAMYQKSVSLRQELTQALKSSLQRVDMLVLPSSPYVAPTWSEIETMTSAQIYAADFMTVPFSLAQLPAISLPWYEDRAGLGIGIQCVGNSFQDLALIKFLSSFEQPTEKI